MFFKRLVLGLLAVSALGCGGSIDTADNHEPLQSKVCGQALFWDGGPVVSQAMVGEWVGQGVIIVSWCEQKVLPIYLTIDPDETVTGFIGDATLTNGVIKRNNPILIWLGNSEFIVSGDLEGAIVSAEDISRDAVKLMLDFQDEQFLGGLRTSGSKFGGKDSMVMAVEGIELNRL